VGIGKIVHPSSFVSEGCQLIVTRALAGTAWSIRSSVLHFGLNCFQTASAKAHAEQRLRTDVDGSGTRGSGPAFGAIGLGVILGRHRADDRPIGDIFLWLSSARSRIGVLGVGPGVTGRAATRHLIGPFGIWLQAVIGAGGRVGHHSSPSREEWVTAARVP
jgi:hypothetical protein